LRRTGRFGEAITRLERASASQPDSEDALYDLAICQEELGRYEEARATLERLVELRPREANYLNFFGYLLAEQGWELERAESMILTALEAEPENPFYLDSLGWVYYQSGRFEEAYDTLILAMEGLGEDPVILEHVGDTLRALGQEAEALDMYRRALERGGEEARLQPRVNELEESLRESP
jgi:tetratricopeptide (TPR) repeat protein